MDPVSGIYTVTVKPSKTPYEVKVTPPSGKVLTLPGEGENGNAFPHEAGRYLTLTADGNGLKWAGSVGSSDRQFDHVNIGYYQDIQSDVIMNPGSLTVIVDEPSDVTFTPSAGCTITEISWGGTDYAKAEKMSDGTEAGGSWTYRVTGIKSTDVNQAITIRVRDPFGTVTEKNFDYAVTGASVTFDLGAGGKGIWADGIESQTREVEFARYGMAVPESKVPEVKDSADWFFIGWTFHGNQVKPEETVIENAGMVFVANYLEKVHDVTFTADSSQGEILGNPVAKVDHGGKLTKEQIPTVTPKSGYAHIGWKGSDGTRIIKPDDLVNLLAETINEDVTFTAVMADAADCSAENGLVLTGESMVLSQEERKLLMEGSQEDKIAAILSKAEAKAWAVSTGLDLPSGSIRIAADSEDSLDDIISAGKEGGIYEITLEAEYTGASADTVSRKILVAVEGTQVGIAKSDEPGNQTGEIVALYAESFAKAYTEKPDADGAVAMAGAKAYLLDSRKQIDTKTEKIQADSDQLEAINDVGAEGTTGNGLPLTFSLYGAEVTVFVTVTRQTAKVTFTADHAGLSFTSRDIILDTRLGEGNIPKVTPDQGYVHVGWAKVGSEDTFIHLGEQTITEAVTYVAVMMEESLVTVKNGYALTGTGFVLPQEELEVLKAQALQDKKTAVADVISKAEAKSWSIVTGKATELHISEVDFNKIISTEAEGGIHEITLLAGDDAVTGTVMVSRKILVAVTGTETTAAAPDAAGNHTKGTVILRAKPFTKAYDKTLKEADARTEAQVEVYLLESMTKLDQDQFSKITVNVDELAAINAVGAEETEAKGLPLTFSIYGAELAVKVTVPRVEVEVIFKADHAALSFTSKKIVLKTKLGKDNVPKVTSASGYVHVGWTEQGTDTFINPAEQVILGASTYVAVMLPSKEVTAGNDCALTGNSFTIEYDEARRMTSELVVEKAGAKAWNMVTGEDVTGIHISEEDVKKITTTPREGGVHEISLLAETKAGTISRTISVTVMEKTNAGSGGSSGGSSGSSRSDFVGRWVNDGWVFIKSNGQKAADEWISVDGKVYRFTENGFMDTSYEGLKFHSDGSLVNPKDAGTLPTAVTGTWLKDGWWYDTGDGGYLRNGWYYLSYEGRSDWYYFDSDGWMLDGWLDDGKNRYYLHTAHDNTRGHMYEGWHLIDGKMYYFYKKEDQGVTGALVRNGKTPDGYTVDENGVWDGRPVR